MIVILQLKRDYVTETAVLDNHNYIINELHKISIVTYFQLTASKIQRHNKYLAIIFERRGDLKIGRKLPQFDSTFFTSTEENPQFEDASVT